MAQRCCSIKGDHLESHRHSSLEQLQLGTTADSLDTGDLQTWLQPLQCSKERRGDTGPSYAPLGRSLLPCWSVLLILRHEQTALPTASCPCCLPGRDSTLSGPRPKVKYWEFNGRLCPTLRLCLGWQGCSYHLAKERQGNQALLCISRTIPTALQWTLVKQMWADCTPYSFLLMTPG